VLKKLVPLSVGSGVGFSSPLSVGGLLLMVLLLVRYILSVLTISIPVPTWI